MREVFFAASAARGFVVSDGHSFLLPITLSDLKAGLDLLGIAGSSRADALVLVQHMDAALLDFVEKRRKRR